MKNLSLLLLVACSSSTPKATTSSDVFVTLNGAAHNVFGPDPTNNAVTTASLAGTCTPNLKVSLFDGTTLLLQPLGTQPLTTCDVSPSDGTFSCAKLDVSSALAIVALIDDADNSVSDCVAPTFSVVMLCATGSCKTEAFAKTGTAKEGDVDILPALVVPSALVSSIDTQLASPLGHVLDSGLILSLVLDANLQPVAGALPNMPQHCAAGGDLSCLSYIENPDTTLGLAVDPSAKLTNALGSYFVQAVHKDAAGDPDPVPFVTADNSAYAEEWGALDCSGATTPVCFSGSALPPFRKGELAPGSGGAITVVYDTVVAAPTGGVCPLVTAVPGLACP